MLTLVRRTVIRGVMAALMLGLVPVPAEATVRSCTATLSPTSVQPGSEAVFTLDLSNTSGPAVQWIQVVRPNTQYFLDAVAADGWSGVMDSEGNSLTLTGGSVPRSATFEFQWAARTGLFADAAANWTVLVSDNADGSGPTMCTGTLASTIEGHLPSEGEGQRISGVTVETTATTATVRWLSEVPTTSVVLFGTTSDYGSTSAYDTAYVTVHQLAISGLSAATGYHFQVAGLDAGGNPSYSGDGTFMTLAAPKATVPAETAAGLPLPRGTIATLAEPAETVPPTVTVTTNVSRPFIAMPQIVGVAEDNVAVAKVDYSLDGGVSWIVVPNPPGLGTKRVRFGFTPNKLDDGNYALVVRVTDTSGNVAQTKAATLVIDLEPPRLGSELVSFGSQPAVVDEAGRYRVAVGADQTLTMNAVGGPIRVVVTATKDGALRPAQTFYLHQDAGSGLWTGVLAFGSAGVYHLAAVATDGADNQTTRALNDVVASAPARVATQAGRAIRGAEVTVYRRDPDTGAWGLWDAEAYGQVNPQHTRATGNFAALLPPGNYYLRVVAAGYRTVITQAFLLDQVTPLVPEIRMATPLRLTLGKWSWTMPGVTLSQTAVNPRGGEVAAKIGTAGLVGRQLPRFSLPLAAGGTVTPLGLQGHPTVVTVLATWSPVASAQLAALAGASAKVHGAQVVALYLGERAGKVQTALAQAGYTLPAIVDAHAILGEGLGVPSAPTHYFVDQTGKVKAVYTGLLSADALVGRLAGL